MLASCIDATTPSVHKNYSPQSFTALIRGTDKQRNVHLWKPSISTYSFQTAWCSITAPV